MPVFSRINCIVNSYISSCQVLYFENTIYIIFLRKNHINCGLQYGFGLPKLKLNPYRGLFEIITHTANLKPQTNLNREKTVWVVVWCGPNHISVLIFLRFEIIFLQLLMKEFEEPFLVLEIFVTFLVIL